MTASAGEMLAWLASRENRDEETRRQAQDILDTLLYIQMTDPAIMVATNQKAVIHEAERGRAFRLSQAAHTPRPTGELVYSGDGVERHALASNEDKQ